LEGDYRRSAPVTIRSTAPLVPAPYFRATSTGSGSIWWPHALHHTISRTRAAAAFPSVIGGPACDLMSLAPWPVANLMLKRYAADVIAESTKRADKLTADGETVGTTIWLRVIDAIEQLANKTPPGPVD